MNDNHDHFKYRIDNSTFIMMVIVAGFFDLAQIASKILYFVSLTLIGAAAGAYVGGEIGAGIGAAAGTLLMFTGYGTAAGFAIGMLLAETFSWIFMIVGAFSMWLWFRIKGVPILDGDRLVPKFLTFMATIVIEFVPVLNATPTLTFWTVRMTTLSRIEDRLQQSAKMKPGLQKAPRRQYVPRSAPQLAYES